MNFILYLIPFYFILYKVIIYIRLYLVTRCQLRHRWSPEIRWVLQGADLW